MAKIYLLRPLFELALFLIVFGLGYLVCLKARQQKERKWTTLGYFMGGIMIISGLVFSILILSSIIAKSGPTKAQPAESGAYVPAMPKVE